jgi:hypothetical protein
LKIHLKKKEKRLKECFQKSDDLQLDRLVMTMGQVAEHSLPSLTRTLLIWHEAQLANLAHMRHQQQLQFDSSLSTDPILPTHTSSTNISAKINKQRLMLIKLETDILDERKELVVHALLCTCLIEILKQLSFHPGNDDLVNYMIDLSFQRFLSKDQQLPAPGSSPSPSYTQHNQLYQDNLFVTDLYAELLGTIAQSRFILVRRRFINEFNRFKLSATSQIIQAAVANNPPIVGSTVANQAVWVQFYLKLLFLCFTKNLSFLLTINKLTKNCF